MPLLGSRVPNCTCNPIHPQVSPLLQVRWKRLVLDEGHVAANTNTNLVPFAKLLSVERRWIVTGTPTTNLLGLSFGQAGQTIPGSSGVSETARPVDEVEAVDLDATEENDDNSEGEPNMGPSVPMRARRWTSKLDGEDLRKLGNMMCNFLGVPQYVADPRAFSTLVKAPLLEPSGPAPGAIKVLEQVMSGYMFRHRFVPFCRWYNLPSANCQGRIEDVEKDVRLPPLTHTTVYLDLEPASMRSYNVMQAMLVLNAVDSQRVDQARLLPTSTGAVSSTNIALVCRTTCSIPLTQLVF